MRRLSANAKPERGDQGPSRVDSGAVAARSPGVKVTRRSERRFPTGVRVGTIRAARGDGNHMEGSKTARVGAADASSDFPRRPSCATCRVRRCFPNEPEGRGILPVTLYPFLGGKVWCRYWCPLAKMMEKTSWLYAKLRISKFAIVANDKCIACNECSRNCQVGIDVMQYALKQEQLDNETSSCIGCGICVTVCPMDTLSFGEGPRPEAHSALATP